MVQFSCNNLVEQLTWRPWPSAMRQNRLISYLLTQAKFPTAFKGNLPMMEQSKSSGSGQKSPNACGLRSLTSPISHKPLNPPKKPRQISATPINPRQQKSPLHLQHPISPHQWKSYREFAQTSNYNYNSRASGPNVHSEFPQRKARSKLPSINLTQVFEATIIQIAPSSMSLENFPPPNQRFSQNSSKQGWHNRKQNLSTRMSDSCVRIWGQCNISLRGTFPAPIPKS